MAMPKLHLWRLLLLLHRRSDTSGIESRSCGLLVDTLHEFTEILSNLALTHCRQALGQSSIVYALEILLEADCVLL